MTEEFQLRLACLQFGQEFADDLEDMIFNADLVYDWVVNGETPDYLVKDKTEYLQKPKDE